MSVRSEADDWRSVPVNVLVVDDRPENRAALRAVLAKLDYSLVEASSGEEALRRLLEEEFAVLLIDVLMPGMNGFELASAARGRDRTATVPIVFVTAQSTEADLMDEGYKAGAVDYLVRPLSAEMIRLKVGVFADLFRQRKRIERQASLLVEAEREASDLRVLDLQVASERHYRSLADAIPQIVWTARPDGTVDYFNQRWFEYTGLSAEQSAGSWEAALHRDDVRRCRDEWRAMLGAGAMFQLECRLRRATDGGFRWHLARAVPERSPMGTVTSWLGTFTDIEDQKRTEAALTEFKGTLDAVLDTVIIFDAEDWRLLYANEGASVLLGREPRELRDMSALDLMAEHDAEAFRELLAPLHDGPSSVVKVEAKFRRRGSTTVSAEVSLQLIRGRLVAIARDITDRKRAQMERELLYREAVDAIRARDEFLSIASHELRTPLSSLQLQIQMLLRPSRKDPQAVPSPAQMKAKLEVAEKQSERLTSLIGELMDVSRISAGRLTLDPEQTDLSAIARDVARRLGEEASNARGLVELTAPSPVVGCWDPVRVEQVVTNLLSNALKFGAGNPIEIAVEDRGRFARLIVRDHGIGIAPEDVERIFHRYQQAVSARAYGGMGLGLYIVRQIVEAHGGTIRVESEPDTGSAFTMDLPREPASTKEESGPSHADEDQRSEIDNRGDKSCSHR